MRQKALAPYHPHEFLPGPSVGDDEASLAKAAGDIGTTIFHPVGTAKMGTASDPMAVVDERLRVIGIAGLARRRCLGDADHHLGQHQHPDRDDRGKGCGDDFGGCEITELSFRGARSASPESIATDGVMDSRACAKWRIPE